MAKFKTESKRLLEVAGSPGPFRDVSVKSTLNTMFRTEKDRRQLKPLMRMQAENVSKSFFLFQRNFEREAIAKLFNQQFFSDLHKPRYFRGAYAKFCKDRKRDLNFPDLSNCSALMENYANQYETAFEENIGRNMRRWIQLHYQFFADPSKSESDAKAYVRELFDGTKVDPLWEVLVDGETLNLVDMRSKKKMFNLIPALMKLNSKIWKERLKYESVKRKSTPFGLRTFNVIAQKQWGTKYVTFNTTAMAQVQNLRARIVNKRNKSLKLDKKPLKKFKDSDPPRKVFKSAFKIERFEREDEKGIKCRFALRISTDGVSASTGLLRRIDEKPALEIVHGEGALDPGIVNEAGVFTRSKKHPEKYWDHIRTAKKHHHLASLPVLNNKRRNATKDIDVRVKRAAHATFNNVLRQYRLNNVLDTDLELIRDDEQFLDEKFAAYSTRKLKAIKLTKHIRTVKAVDQFVSSVIPAKTNIVMYYGDGWHGPTSFHGHVTAPLNDLYQSFVRHPRTEVHVVSEFRTSKLCPRCHRPLTHPKPPHRYCYCPGCEMSFNRDLAAAENILKNGIVQVGRMTAEEKAAEAGVKNMIDRRRVVFDRIKRLKAAQVEAAQARWRQGQRAKRVRYPDRKWKLPNKPANYLQLRQQRLDRLRAQAGAVPVVQPAVVPPDPPAPRRRHLPAGRGRQRSASPPAPVEVRRRVRQKSATPPPAHELVCRRGPSQRHPPIQPPRERNQDEGSRRDRQVPQQSRSTSSQPPKESTSPARPVAQVPEPLAASSRTLRAQNRAQLRRSREGSAEIDQFPLIGNAQGAPSQREPGPRRKMTRASIAATSQQRQRTPESDENSPPSKRVRPSPSSK